MIPLQMIPMILIYEVVTQLAMKNLIQMPNLMMILMKIHPMMMMMVVDFVEEWFSKEEIHGKTIELHLLLLLLLLVDGRMVAMFVVFVVEVEEQVVHPSKQSKKN